MIQNYFKSAAFYFALTFCCGFILFFPVEYYLFPNPGNFTEGIIKPVIYTVGTAVLGLPDYFTTDIRSDSLSSYILIFLLVILATVSGLVVALFSKGKVNPKIKLWLFTILAYYLSLTLMKYGADKLFKHQFFLLEPNTLYTPVGQLTPDILFWSSMGSSYTYSVFSGIIEIIPALLLLFRKTRLLGILFSIGVLTNVVMINFGFDITVKVYSLFLLVVALVLLAPHIKSLTDFFLRSKPADQIKIDVLIDTKKSLVYYSLVKTLMLGLIIYESFGVYFEMNNLNDDTAPRPPLYGAYDVQLFTENNYIIPATLSNPDRFKRIFFHRRSYFIVQTMDDRFFDYGLKLDTSAHTMTLYNPQAANTYQQTATLNYQQAGNDLIIYGYLFDSHISLSSKKTDLDELPLLKEKMHWTVESFKD